MNSVYEGCDGSQPTKAVTGHRTPKSYFALAATVGVGSSVTVESCPSIRYMRRSSSKLKGRAPRRPKTAIWLPLPRDHGDGLTLIQCRRRAGCWRRLARRRFCFLRRQNDGSADRGEQGTQKCNQSNEERGRFRVSCVGACHWISPRDCLKATRTNKLIVRRSHSARLAPNRGKAALSSFCACNTTLLCANQRWRPGAALGRRSKHVRK